MKLRWLVLATLCASMYGQAVRFDGNVTQPAANVPPGAAANVMTVPNAIVTICGYPAVGNPCTNTVPIWQDQITTVPQPQPIRADSLGRFGFWITPGQYSYSVQTQSGKTVGTFPLTLTSPAGPQGPGGPGCGAADCIVTNPTATQTITQPANTDFNVVTSGTGEVQHNGIPVLSGKSFAPGLIVFGDSIANYVGASGISTSFVGLLASQMGGTLNNTAVSGWWMQDEPMEMYLSGTAGYNGSAVSIPTQGNNPMNLEQAGKNDSSTCQANANCNANSQLALQTILTHRSTNNIVSASSATTTGVWATDSVLPTAKASTTNGSTITFSIVTYGSSAIGVAYRAITSNGGTASVTIDGSLQGTGITASGVGGTQIISGVRASVFTNLYPVSAGNHVVVVTVTSSTNAANLISIPDVVSAPNPAAYFAPPSIAAMEIIPFQGNTNPTWTDSLNAIKRATVTALQGYGFNVQYLPVVNVPCTNGTSNCSGGFNNATYISNQPGAFNPDGMSCAGSTTDNVHPNDCGHAQIFKAIQKGLGIVQGFAATQTGAPQTIYTTSHTLTQGDGVVYMNCSSACTLTLPDNSSNWGPFTIYVFSGTSPVTVTAASGAVIGTVPATLPAGSITSIVGYVGGAWNMLFADPTQQNIYTTSHTLIESDGVVYMNCSSACTLTLPSNTHNWGPFVISVFSGTSPVAVVAASGAVMGTVPATLPARSVTSIVGFAGGAWNMLFQNSLAGLGGTTGNLGGTPLAAGACANITAPIPAGPIAAPAGSPVAVSRSDGFILAGNFFIQGSVLPAGTVNVQVCAITAGTPAVETYNFQVIPVH